jgi:hypothetical protein
VEADACALVRKGLICKDESLLVTGPREDKLFRYERLKDWLNFFCEIDLLGPSPVADELDRRIEPDTVFS